MASGLIALLDDVAAITKLAAASLDDIAGAAGKAGSKAAGVVIDDAAVTPRYVVGFSPERELPIIGKIALGSLRNKLLFLLPAAVALSAFASWAITPLLMLGGAYLAYEAAEKVAGLLFGHDEPTGQEAAMDPEKLEQEKVAGAIRTDFILSAEIMAIALADVADRSLTTQGVVLAAVGILVTAGVYGAVAVIVKMDDVGVHLARGSVAPLRAVGRGLVSGMPKLMRILSSVGTAAMAWVGGGIIVHGLEEFGLTALPHAVHGIAEAAGAMIPAAHAIVEWIVGAALAGVVGLLVGGAIMLVMHQVKRLRTPSTAHA